MSETSKAREHITRFAKSIYDRDLTKGSTGNISVSLSDGQSFGDPNRQFHGVS